MVETPRSPAGVPGPEPDLIAQLAAKGPQDSRYELQGEVARGGMGAIIKIWDKELQRNLAMKLILGREADGSSGLDVTPAKLARFLEEAQITGQLDHPGIVPVHEIGIDSQGQVYFTMKLVKGVDLREVLDQVRDGRNGWSVTRALGVISKVCEAMSYAHDKGVIHRDLKPGNVMVGKFGEVYVMDWGLARVVGRNETKDIRLKDSAFTASSIRTGRQKDRSSTPDSPLLTMDGDVVGTPAYMAPEQAMGHVSEVGVRADVYAVGSMLYHLLSGEAPYVPRGARVSPHTVLMAVLNGPPKPILQLAPQTPAELIAICEKAMAREKENRYESMLELQADLQSFLEGRVVRAHETGAFAELKKWTTRNKGTAIAAASAVFLAISGLGGIAVVQANANKALELKNADLKIARDEKSAALDDVLRLSDVKRLGEYKTTAAEKLWPPLPDKVVAMEEWLAGVRSLVNRLPQHQKTLNELRGQALPYTEADAERDRNTHPRAAELAELRESRSRLVGAPVDGLAGKLAEVDSKIEKLEKLVSARRTWSFEKAESRWQHDTLSELVAGIEIIADRDPAIGTIADVEERLAFASTVAKKTFEDAREAWDAAVKSIANKIECPQYRGLLLAPQIGLVPIGKDLESGLWEFAHLASGEPAKRRADGKLEITEKSGLVFVLLPGGTFNMGAVTPDAGKPAGSPNVDPDAQKDESPVNEIAVDPFFLSKYEMTQMQWLRATRRNPSAFPMGTTSAGRKISRLNPVEQVSWLDCADTLLHLDLVLPTEAQWEYGARAGTTTPWWCGETVSEIQFAGNIADKHAQANGGEEWPCENSIDDGFVVHAPVGSFRPNAFGLYDTLGNVWEYCRDVFGDYKQSARPNDGMRSPKGGTDRAARGGCFASRASFARSATRSYAAPAAAAITLGVRPAREITR